MPVMFVIGPTSQRRRCARSARAKAIPKPIATEIAVRYTCCQKGST
jgi:hypothetical protein